jgi:hypothetical protein
MIKILSEFYFIFLNLIYKVVINTNKSRKQQNPKYLIKFLHEESSRYREDHLSLSRFFYTPRTYYFSKISPYISGQTSCIRVEKTIPKHHKN